MNIAVKSFEPTDYEEVKPQLDVLHKQDQYLKDLLPHVRIDTPSRNPDCHPAKLWEWARVMKAIEDTFGPRRGLRILDIGAAYSLLGPVLACQSHTVIEADPEPRPGMDELLRYIKANDGGGFQRFHHGFGSLIGGVGVAEQFDVVLCISTIEHVPPEPEREAWKEMVTLTKVNGLLIVTTDVMDRPVKGYKNDSVRFQNFDMAMCRERIDYAKSLGMSPIGAEDYEYHGAHVFDYSFFFSAMKKMR